MDAQSYTAQERRAANQVWAAAGAYGFEPLFLARNTDGTIDFYMNCIVGLVHKYYGDTLIRDIFSAWDGDTRQPMLDDMAWLYLENAAYRLELPRRPVLEAALPLRWSRRPYRNQHSSKTTCWRCLQNLPCLTARYVRSPRCICGCKAFGQSLLPKPCPPR